ncbi:hypothetical protein [Niabella terrae]
MKWALFMEMRGRRITSRITGVLRIDMLLRKIVVLLLLIPTFHALRAQPVVEKKYEWHQQGFYILNPAFAHRNQELVFVRQRSGKDSSNQVAGFTAGALKNFLGGSASTRIYDPVITLLDIGNRRFSLLDYGWAPAFSPDDRHIAYSYQLQPLQKGDRLYAAALQGNYLKLFDRNKSASRAITRQGRFYQTDPFFADSSNIVYKTGERVNGPYGGGVSFNNISLKTGKITVVRLAAIKHRLYTLMGDAYKLDDRLAYTVYAPADTGRGMAARYEHLLLSGTDTLQHFGTRAYTDLNYKIAFNDKKEILFIQDNSFTAEDTSFLVAYKKGRALRKIPLPFKFTRCFLSPDGDYLLYITAAQEAFLADTRNWARTQLNLPKQAFHGVRWDEQGQRLALVQDHPTLSGTDILYVFSVKQRRN